MPGCGDAVDPALEGKCGRTKTISSLRERRRFLRGETSVGFGPVIGVSYRPYNNTFCAARSFRSEIVTPLFAQRESTSPARYPTGRADSQGMAFHGIESLPWGQSLS